MKIRAITLYVCCNSFESVLEEVRAASASAASLAAYFTELGYEVQTTRLALNSFEEWVRNEDPVDCVKELVGLLDELKVDFFNLGPALTAKGRALLLPLLLLSPRLSSSCMCTSPSSDSSPTTNTVDESAVASAAEVTVALGRETEGGFGNFRFCASFCMPPHVAFFPAAHAPSVAQRAPGASDPIYFALGLECGDLAQQAMTAAVASEGAAAGQRLRTQAVTSALTSTFTAALVPLEAHAKAAAAALHPDAGSPRPVAYCGIDASLNPGLAEDYSVGSAFENALGGKSFGNSGTLAVAAAVTAALKALPVSLTGYSGLMLPPLEDTCLARTPRAYGVTDLLSYSSVCGVGLDTVPLPGATSAQEIEALLHDVAALACKWNKPLSGRLFPVPGKAAGDMTEFDSPFLINTRVFSMP